jgi:hypothetical protein
MLTFTGAADSAKRTAPHWQRVAAGEDEIDNAGGTKCGFLFAGPARQIDMFRTRGLKGLCGVGRLRGVDLVGGAEAGQCSAGGFECSGEGGEILHLSHRER